MTKDRAIAVLEILTRHCGYECSGLDLSMFVAKMEEDCEEYRFQGDLAFGGKIYNDKGKLRVDCYPEDMTPARKSAIKAANKALAKV